MKKRNPNPERSELLHPLVSLLLFDKEKPNFSVNKTCKLSPSYFKFSEVPDLIRSENFALKLDSFFKLLTIEQRDKLISQLVKSVKFEIVYGVLMHFADQIMKYMILTRKNRKKIIAKN